MAKLKGRAKEFADLAAPVSKGFDPEADIPAEGSDDSDSEASDDGLAGTEHYGEVGKSKLRQPDVGPQYAGSRISREALFNDENEESAEPGDDDEEFANLENADLSAEGDEDDDIDSDAAFCESDTEKFKKFTFRGSSQPASNGVKGRAKASDFMSDSEEEEEAVDAELSEENETDEDILDVDEQHSEEQGDSESSEGEDEGSVPSEASESDEGSENDNDNGSDEKARREELRKIMNEEQTTVIATISQAAKGDADKGNAVKQQRSSFDSLLNVRIALQKALVATNSMATVEEDDADTEDEPYQAAEDAALKLWNTLDRMRHEFIQTSSTSKTGHKRKRDADSSTSSSAIWERMQDSEVASLDSRRRVLEKWWGKVKGSTPTAGKLIDAAPTQNITSSLQDQLARPGLLENTKRPRSCAPLQEKQKLIQDPNIYDDTSFYKLLLNQLVEQRKMDSGPTSGRVDGITAQWAVKEAKLKKVVDTKASKGRKMRYTVHEKLQNFMAPEDRASWEQEATDRLFGTLLGQKMSLGEDAMEVDEEEDISPEEAGLRLFRS